MPFANCDVIQSTAQIQRLLKLNWNSSRLQADLVIVAHRPNPASHKEEKKDYYIYRAHNSRWPVRLLELSDPIQSVLLLLFPLVITSAAVLPIIAWPHLSSNDIITLYVYIYTYRVAVGYTWPFFFARIRYATLTGSTASLIIQQQRRIDFARYDKVHWLQHSEHVI